MHIKNCKQVPRGVGALPVTNESVSDDQKSQTPTTKSLTNVRYVQTTHIPASSEIQEVLICLFL